MRVFPIHTHTSSQYITDCQPSGTSQAFQRKIRFSTLYWSTLGGMLSIKTTFPLVGGTHSRKQFQISKKKCSTRCYITFQDRLCRQKLPGRVASFAALKTAFFSFFSFLRSRKTLAVFFAYTRSGKSACMCVFCLNLNDLEMKEPARKYFK